MFESQKTAGPGAHCQQNGPRCEGTFEPFNVFPR